MHKPNTYAKADLEVGRPVSLRKSSLVSRFAGGISSSFWQTGAPSHRLGSVLPPVMQRAATRRKIPQYAGLEQRLRV